MSGPECQRSVPVRTPFVSNQTAIATYEDCGGVKGTYLADLPIIYGTTVKIQVTGNSDPTGGRSFRVDSVSTGTDDDDDAIDAGVDTSLEMHIMDVHDNTCSVWLQVDGMTCEVIEKQAGLYTACVSVPHHGACITVYVSLNGERIRIDSFLCNDAPPPPPKEVEAIIGRMIMGEDEDQEILYHVRWKGLDRNADSYIFDDDFTEPHLVTDYELRLPTHERTHRYTDAVMLVEQCTSSELIADMEAKYPHRTARFAVVIPCGGGKTTMVRVCRSTDVDEFDLIDFDDLVGAMPKDADYTNAVRIRDEIFSGVHNGRVGAGGKIEQIRRDNFAYFAERGNAALQALVPEDDDRCVAVHSVSMAKALGLTILATYVPDDRVVDDPAYSRLTDIPDYRHRSDARRGFLAGFKAVRDDAERHGLCVTDYPELTSLLPFVLHDWSSRAHPCYAPQTKIFED
jgi:hypothetical protein